MAHHHRNDSFGDFVAAEEVHTSSEGTSVMNSAQDIPDLLGDDQNTEPLGKQDTILDLRDVERRLDSQRKHQQDQQEQSAAMASAIDPSLALVAEPVTILETQDATQQPTEPNAPLQTHTSEPPANHHPLWSGSLWDKLSALRSFTELGTHPEKPKPGRRPSVVHHAATTDAPISGAPGFDAHAARHWNTGSWSLSGAEERKREQKPIPVSLVGRREDTDAVVEHWHAARIQASLPRRLRLGHTWRLLYSLDQHGSSLSTLYDKTARGLEQREQVGSALHQEGWLRGSSAAAQQATLGLHSHSSDTSSSALHMGTGVSLRHAGLVLAISDAHGNVFGAFLNEALKVASHYYGTGECFLWKTVKRRLPVPPSEAGGAEENTDMPDLHPEMALEVFSWTGQNDYVILSESNFLSVGNGDGKYGLWLDETLTYGSSARCPTFNNQVLCNAREWINAKHATDTHAVPCGDLLGDLRPDSDPIPEKDKFQIIGVEIWAVGLD
ncbi:oxidation resistance protein 1 [Malassezia yamatoensis]|uniref:Oxidation resistance protein 1 n=1 Tax=Malassezia yamatoensis TaxID=253288 RepID=A0AAJ5YRP1_9BASI|nr:oxidation resistance protein 1 [Malassezia yamatoensis]